MTIDLSKHLDLSNVPDDTLKMINNLPDSGKQALINHYDKNSEYYKVANPINLISNIILNTIKNKIYHYTTFDALKKIVSSNVFLIKSYKKMNDKSEFKYTYNLCKKILKNLGASEIALKYFNEYIENHIFIKDTYIWSFTENRNSQTLYGNYTNNKDGIALEFDAQKIMKTLANYFSRGKKTLEEYTIGNSFVFPMKVIYEEDKQKKILKPLLDQYLKAFDNYSLDPNDMRELIIESINPIIFYSMCFKNSLLRQEEEVRFIITNLINNNNKIPDKIINGVEYMTIPFYPSILNECIIQTGSKIKDKDVTEVLNKNNFKNTLVSKSDLPY